MDVAHARGGRLAGENSRFAGKPPADRKFTTRPADWVWGVDLVFASRAPSDMGHGNLDAIVASHQDTVLGPAQMRNTDRQPYADRQEGNGKGKRRHVRQHAMAVIVGLFAIALVARQIVGYFELMNQWRIVSALRDGRARTRPKLEHAVLFLWRGRNDGLLGSHGCQLRGGSFSSSTLALHLEEKIG
jgi:hypothetical protein